MARTQPTAEPQVTYSSGRADDGTPDLRILHYNDVYHVDPSSAEPVGGFPRFMTLCKEYRDGSQFAGQSKLITLFSGDAFNPSLESSVTKGKHMVPVLNAIGTDVACVGNHDFDFGVKQFEALAEKCKFPWLIANVLDPALGQDVPLGNAKPTHMLTSSNGVKIGLIGLGEREWLATINSLPPNLIYKSASATAKELIPGLRAEGAEIIICLSHMREPNDVKLAEQTDGLIDIILGGHDHFYNHQLVRGTHVLRSGTDFKNLSYIEARRRREHVDKWDFDIWRRDVTSQVKEHYPSTKLVANLTADLKKSLAKPIGWCAMPLDARFSTVRTKESNIGNFVCDIMRQHYHADCCIMAAGTIRGDQIYPPGAVRIKDVTTCFPFEDPVVLLRVTGQAIWDAIENGVSTYPAQEGRFPQVSNIVFSFDPARERNKRVLSLELGGKPLELDRKYLLATRGYMGRGKDGFDSLLVQSEGGQAEELVDEENGILISTMLRQYFMALRTVGKWRKLSEHWETVASKLKSNTTQARALAPSDDLERSLTLSRESSRLSDADRTDSWHDFILARLGHSKTPHDDDDEDDRGLHELAEDGVADGAPPQAAEPDVGADPDNEMDIEILLLRKFWARWTRKAGITSSVCEPAGDGGCLVDWTRLIAPTVEGRITMVESKS
ncbi:ser Thr phosphatase family [Cordyceps militaris]|uniref:Ser Thr phosphatase family n=1 Tax=Cordyceps militaris TaxID=73501 RepID=A0A2H4SUK1_CORMI|nr:ser Thr phosphatase family [Cordyceps militaris]